MKKGFTLMELIVVMGIFSMVVVAATDIFLLANKAERKVFSLERAQADARFSIEAIVREVRAGSIDYEYYGGSIPSGAQQDLALIDSTNQKIRFFVADTVAEGCANEESSPCLAVAVGNASAIAMTPKGVRAERVDFYIAPSEDPFVFDTALPGFPVHTQPRVTIVLKLVSGTERVGEESVIHLQTTVTNRRYVR